MKARAPKLTDLEYEKNFAELQPAMTPNQAMTEAARCLYCHDAPCMQACPTHIDVSAFIKKIATGNIKGSAKTILRSNWIALTCAKACPVEVLCEGACVYVTRREKPIGIGRLQRYAIDWYFAQGMPPLFPRRPEKGTSVGIIGAGPAGLACAAELALLGYTVTVYERRPLAGGLSTWGIAPYKMSRKDSLNEVTLVEKLGVRILTNINIGTDIAPEELERRHDALFIATGLHEPVAVGITGDDLAGIIPAIEFIGNVTQRNWHTIDVGNRVVVLGGGNTAIDAATEAKRLGAKEVTIVYRRSEADMPAYRFEIELARKDRVNFEFLTTAKRFIGSGVVEAVECIRTTPTAGDRTRRIGEIPGSEFQLPADMVIIATGQGMETALSRTIAGLRSSDGRIAVDPSTMQTSNPRYFAGGDCCNGGREVVHAAAEGKRAAHGIDAHLSTRS